MASELTRALSSPRKLANAIVSDYLRRIACEELVEGDRLPTEPELCAEYGVSRSAVREAIQSLAAKGFVLARQGSGTQVASRQFWNTLDPEFLQWQLGDERFRHLIEAREVLEPAIAAAAAERATDEQRVLLRELLEAHVRTPAEDRDAHAHIDVGFHELLAEATHNPVMISLHHMITALGLEMRATAARMPGAVDRAALWHEQILIAIESQDSAMATDAMRMHMRQVRSELEAMTEVPSTEES